MNSYATTKVKWMTVVTVHLHIVCTDSECLHTLSLQLPHAHTPLASLLPSSLFASY